MPFPLPADAAVLGALAYVIHTQRPGEEARHTAASIGVPSTVDADGDLVPDLLVFLHPLAPNAVRLAIDRLDALLPRDLPLRVWVTVGVPGEFDPLAGSPPAPGPLTAEVGYDATASQAPGAWEARFATAALGGDAHYLLSIRTVASPLAAAGSLGEPLALLARVVRTPGGGAAGATEVFAAFDPMPTEASLAVASGGGAEGSRFGLEWTASAPANLAMVYQEDAGGARQRHVVDLAPLPPHATFRLVEDAATGETSIDYEAAMTVDVLHHLGVFSPDGDAATVVELDAVGVPPVASLRTQPGGFELEAAAPLGRLAFLLANGPAPPFPSAVDHVWVYDVGGLSFIRAQVTGLQGLRFHHDGERVDADYRLAGPRPFAARVDRDPADSIEVQVEQLPAALSLRANLSRDLSLRASHPVGRVAIGARLGTAEYAVEVRDIPRSVDATFDATAGRVAFTVDEPLGSAALRALDAAGLGGGPYKELVANVTSVPSFSFTWEPGGAGAALDVPVGELGEILLAAATNGVVAPEGAHLALYAGPGVAGPTESVSLRLLRLREASVAFAPGRLDVSLHSAAAMPMQLLHQRGADAAYASIEDLPGRVEFSTDLERAVRYRASNPIALVRAEALLGERRFAVRLEGVPEDLTVTLDLAEGRLAFVPSQPFGRVRLELTDPAGLGGGMRAALLDVASLAPFTATWDHAVPRFSFEAAAGSSGGLPAVGSLILGVAESAVAVPASPGLVLSADAGNRSMAARVDQLVRAGFSLEGGRLDAHLSVREAQVLRVLYRKGADHASAEIDALPRDLRIRSDLRTGAEVEASDPLRRVEAWASLGGRAFHARLEDLNLTRFEATFDVEEGRAAFATTSTIGRVLLEAADPAGLGGGFTHAFVDVRRIAPFVVEWGDDFVSYAALPGPGAVAAIGSVEMGAARGAVATQPEPGVLLVGQEEGALDSVYGKVLELRALRVDFADGALDATADLGATYPLALRYVAGADAIEVLVEDMPRVFRAATDFQTRLLVAVSETVARLHITGRLRGLAFLGLLERLPTRVELVLDAATRVGSLETTGTLGLLSFEVEAGPEGIAGTPFRTMALRLEEVHPFRAAWDPGGTFLFDSGAVGADAGPALGSVFFGVSTGTIVTQPESGVVVVDGAVRSVSARARGVLYLAASLVGGQLQARLDLAAPELVKASFLNGTDWAVATVDQVPASVSVSSDLQTRVLYEASGPAQVVRLEGLVQGTRFLGLLEGTPTRVEALYAPDAGQGRVRTDGTLGRLLLAAADPEGLGASGFRDARLEVRNLAGLDASWALVPGDARVSLEAAAPVDLVAFHATTGPLPAISEDHGLLVLSATDTVLSGKLSGLRAASFSASSEGPRTSIHAEYHLVAPTMFLLRYARGNDFLSADLPLPSDLAVDFQATLAGMSVGYLASHALSELAASGAFFGGADPLHFEARILDLPRELRLELLPPAKRVVFEAGAPIGGIEFRAWSREQRVLDGDHMLLELTPANDAFSFRLGGLRHFEGAFREEEVALRWQLHPGGRPFHAYGHIEPEEPGRPSLEATLAIENLPAELVVEWLAPVQGAAAGPQVRQVHARASAPVDRIDATFRLASANFTLSLEELPAEMQAVLESDAKSGTGRLLVTTDRGLGRLAAGASDPSGLFGLPLKVAWVDVEGIPQGPLQFSWSTSPAPMAFRLDAQPSGIRQVQFFFSTVHQEAQTYLRLPYAALLVDGSNATSHGRIENLLTASLTLVANQTRIDLALTESSYFQADLLWRGAGILPAPGTAGVDASRDAYNYTTVFIDRVPRNVSLVAELPKRLTYFAHEPIVRIGAGLRNESLELGLEVRGVPPALELELFRNDTVVDFRPSHPVGRVSAFLNDTRGLLREGGPFRGDDGITLMDCPMCAGVASSAAPSKLGSMADRPWKRVVLDATSVPRFDFSLNLTGGIRAMLEAPQSAAEVFAGISTHPEHVFRADHAAVLYDVGDETSVSAHVPVPRRAFVNLTAPAHPEDPEAPPFERLAFDLQFAAPVDYAFRVIQGRSLNTSLVEADVLASLRGVPGRAEGDVNLSDGLAAQLNASGRLASLEATGWVALRGLRDHFMALRLTDLPREVRVGFRSTNVATDTSSPEGNSSRRDEHLALDLETSEPLGGAMAILARRQGVLESNYTLMAATLAGVPRSVRFSSASSVEKNDAKSNEAGLVDLRLGEPVGLAAAAACAGPFPPVARSLPSRLADGLPMPRDPVAPAFGDEPPPLAGLQALAPPEEPVIVALAAETPAPVSLSPRAPLASASDLCGHVGEHIRRSDPADPGWASGVPDLVAAHGFQPSSNATVNLTAVLTSVLAVAVGTANQTAAGEGLWATLEAHGDRPFLVLAENASLRAAAWMSNLPRHLRFEMDRRGDGQAFHAITDEPIERLVAAIDLWPTPSPEQGGGPSSQATLVLRPVPMELVVDLRNGTSDLGDSGSGGSPADRVIDVRANQSIDRLLIALDGVPPDPGSSTSRPGSNFTFTLNMTPPATLGEVVVLVSQERGLRPPCAAAPRPPPPGDLSRFEDFVCLERGPPPDDAPPPGGPSATHAAEPGPRGIFAKLSGFRRIEAQAEGTGSHRYQVAVQRDAPGLAYLAYTDMNRSAPNLPPQLRILAEVDAVPREFGFNLSLVHVNGTRPMDATESGDAPMPMNASLLEVRAAFRASEPIRAVRAWGEWNGSGLEALLEGLGDLELRLSARSARHGGLNPSATPMALNASLDLAEPLGRAFLILHRNGTLAGLPYRFLRADFKDVLSSGEILVSRTDEALDVNASFQLPIGSLHLAACGECIGPGHFGGVHEGIAVVDFEQLPESDALLPSGPQRYHGVYMNFDLPFRRMDLHIGNTTTPEDQNQTGPTPVPGELRAALQNCLGFLGNGAQTNRTWKPELLAAFDAPATRPITVLAMLQRPEALPERDWCIFEVRISPLPLLRQLRLGDGAFTWDAAEPTTVEVHAFLDVAGARSGLDLLLMDIPQHFQVAWGDGAVGLKSSAPLGYLDLRVQNLQVPWLEGSSTRLNGRVVLFQPAQDLVLDTANRTGFSWETSPQTGLFAHLDNLTAPEVANPSLLIHDFFGPLYFDNIPSDLLLARVSDASFEFDATLSGLHRLELRKDAEGFALDARRSTTKGFFVSGSWSGLDLTASIDQMPTELHLTHRRTGTDGGSVILNSNGTGSFGPVFVEATYQLRYATDWAAVPLLLAPLRASVSLGAVPGFVRADWNLTNGVANVFADGPVVVSARVDILYLVALLDLLSLTGNSTNQTEPVPVRFGPDHAVEQPPPDGSGVTARLDNSPQALHLEVNATDPSTGASALSVFNLSALPFLVLGPLSLSVGVNLGDPAAPQPALSATALWDFNATGSIKIAANANASVSLGISIPGLVYAGLGLVVGPTGASGLAADWDLTSPGYFHFDGTIDGFFRLDSLGGAGMAFDQVRAEAFVAFSVEVVDEPPFLPYMVWDVSVVEGRVCVAVPWDGGLVGGCYP